MMSPKKAEEAWPAFDSHTHAFPDKVAATAMPKLTAEAKWTELHPSFNGTVSGLAASLERSGIERCILCSVATRPEQVGKITEWSVAIASERIVPFASVHPDCPDVEAQVERVVAAGLKGLKFHPQYMNCALEDPRTLRIARAAEAAGLAMVFHAGYDLAYEKDELASPRGVRAVHEAAPRLRMVACHMGGWQRWEEVVEHVAGLPIYLETSYTLGQCPPKLLEKILSMHSPELLMFGSDAPWADQAAELAKFKALPLPDEVKRAALWENVHRFAGLDVE